MTCDEARILLHALLDNELDACHAREVEAHIASCPDCAAEFAAQREMQRVLADINLRYTAPASLRARIEASLPQAPRQQPSRRSVLRGFAMGSAVSALAASGVVAVVLRQDDQQRILSEVVSAHLRSLQAGHLIDVVSTDHCPFCMVGQKDAGAEDFLKIPNGIGGVEYRLLLLFDRGVAAGRISLEQLVAITATNPAKLFGLYPAKGSLMVGADADVVVFDPNGETRLSVASSPSLVDYSIYEGWSVAGAIRRVLSRGTVVVADGVVQDRMGHGRFVARGRTTT